jgi:hypothetical protein
MVLLSYVASLTLIREDWRRLEDLIVNPDPIVGLIIPSRNLAQGKVLR